MLLLLLIGSCSHSWFLAVRTFLFLTLVYPKGNLGPSLNTFHGKAAASLVSDTVFTSRILVFFKSTWSLEVSGEQHKLKRRAADTLCTRD